MKKTLLLLAALFIVWVTGYGQCSNTPCPSGLVMPSLQPSDACVICDLIDLHGYQGISGTVFNPVPVPSPFCGSVETAQWFAFMAPQSFVTFELTPSNCTVVPSGEGIQAEIYGTGDCQNIWVPMSNCWSPGVSIPGTLSATNLTPGGIYYLFIDSWAGSICDFEISVLEPVGGVGPTPMIPTPNPIIGPQEVCLGGSFTYSTTFTPGITNYIWEVNPPIGIVNSNLNTSNAPITWTSPGVAQVCVTNNNGCQTSLPVCTTVTVTNAPPTILEVDLCIGDCIVCGGEVICAPGIYDVTITSGSYLGCDSLVTCIVNVLPPLMTVLDTVSLYPGECFESCGNLFCHSDGLEGLQTTTCIGFQGCDSTIVFPLDLINVVAVITPPMPLTCLVETIILDGLNSITGPNSTYFWTGPNGFSSTEIAITVTVPGEYCLTVMDLATGETDTTCITVIEITDPPPAPQIFGADTLYTNVGFYSIDPIPYVNGYTWSVPSGEVILNADGTAGVVVFPQTTGLVEFCVLSENDCGVGADTCQIVFLDTLPITADLIGTDIGCADVEYWYWLETEDTSITALNWNIIGGEITFGQGADTVFVEWYSATQGAICIEIESNDFGEYELCKTVDLEDNIDYTFIDIAICEDDCFEFAAQNFCEEGIYEVVLSSYLGCDSVIIINLEILNTALPEIIGNLQVCEGSVGDYFIVNYEPFAFYTWTPPPGAVVTWSQDQAVVDFSGASSGELCVTAETGCDPTPQNCIFINVGNGNAPEQPIVSGLTAICVDGMQVFVIDNYNAANNYIWTVPNGVLFDDLGSSIEVNFGNVTEGEICVVAENGCGTSAVTCLFAQVIDSFQISSIIYECDATLTSYTVSFEISGGAPTTYSVNPPNSGILTSVAPYVFTSFPIPVSQGYAFQVDDICNTMIVEGIPFPCECESEVGQMDLALVEICGTNPSTFFYDDSFEFLDVNDVRTFFLHEGSGTFLQNIIASNEQPIFGFDPATMTVGTTYYISAAVGNDDGSGHADLNDPCFTVSQGTPVVFLETPTGILLGDGSICLGSGESVPVVFEFTGQAPWVVDWQINGLVQPPITALSNPWTIEVFENQTSIIEIIGVVDATGCVGEVMGTFFLNVSPVTQTQNINMFCNAINTEYQLNFELIGEGPFSIAPNLGTVSTSPPYFFASNPIPSGEGIVFDITDVNGCVSTFTQDPYFCTCISQVGEMDSEVLGDCGDGPITATYDNSNQVFDGNDVLNFILHEGSGNLIENIIELNTNEPTFVFNPITMIYGTTYYISAVIGDDAGNGEVNLDEPCLSIAAGTPIIFYEVPMAEFLTPSTTICEGETVDLVIGFTGTPPWGLVYSDGVGTFQVPTITASPFTISVQPTTTTTYSIPAITGNMCTGFGINTLTVEVAPDLSIESISNDTTVCDDEFLELNVMATGATTYEWSPAVSLSCSTCQNPVAAPTTNTNYTVVMTNAAGCTTSESMQVFVQCFEVYDTIPIGGISLQSLNLPPWEVVAPADLCDDEFEEVTSFGFFPNNSGLFYVGLAIGMDTLCVLLEHPSNSSITQVFTFYITVTEEDLTMLQGGNEEEGFFENGKTQAFSNENKVENEVQLYPNPAQDELIISANKGGLERVELYSISGKLLWQEKLDGHYNLLNISELKAGSYFAKIDIGGRVLMRKVLVLR